MKHLKLYENFKNNDMLNLLPSEEELATIVKKYLLKPEFQKVTMDNGALPLNSEDFVSSNYTEDNKAIILASVQNIFKFEKSLEGRKKLEAYLLSKKLDSDIESFINHDENLDNFVINTSLDFEFCLSKLENGYDLTYVINMQVLYDSFVRMAYPYNGNARLFDYTKEEMLKYLGISFDVYSSHIINDLKN